MTGSHQLSERDRQAKAFQERYKKTLNLPSDPPEPSTPPPLPAEPGSNHSTEPSNLIALEKALNRAYELRTFEIEHYWKRATYFWGFQIAIFAAVGLLWKDPKSDAWQPVALALASLGCLTALANALSAQGSKFWQKNWEHHIDMLEDEVEGRLHKTVWLVNGGVSFSVSRINQTLGWYFFIFWILVFAFECAKGWATPLGLLDLDEYSRLFVLIMVALTGGGSFCLCWQTTDLRGSIPRADGQHDASIRQIGLLRKRIVAECIAYVRRYAPSEDAGER